VSVLAGVLCQQGHFAEAQSLLLDQKRELSTRDLPLRDLLVIERKLGEVLARAGNSRQALPILMSVATNRLGTARDCVEAAVVAVGSGDPRSYRDLCAISILRFAAGAEGMNAGGL